MNISIFSQFVKNFSSVLAHVSILLRNIVILPNSVFKCDWYATEGKILYYDYNGIYAKQFISRFIRKCYVQVR